MVRRARRAQPGRRKKLSGAGQYWAGGRSRVKDQTEQDAKAWGIEHKARPKEPDVFEVWEEHWPALELFLALRTQWRVIAGMGGAQHQGLDYTALYGHPSFARLDYDEQDKLLAQIQHIEVGALASFNEQTHLAEQEAEQQAQVAESIQYRNRQQYLVRVKEIMNHMGLTPETEPDAGFVA